MVQVSLTTNEILALLDNALQISFGCTYGTEISRKRYTKKTFKQDLFDYLVVSATKKLKKAINLQNE